MKDVFSMVWVDSDKVVLKINADDTLTVAMNPYISKEYEYITVTRGPKHILTITYTNGSTFSFHWGEGGHTLISESLEVLKRKVVEFIEDVNHTLLDWDDGQIDEAIVYFNKNYDKWQLTLRGNRPRRQVSAYTWPKGINTLEDMLKCSKDYIGNIIGWTHSTASTGIEVWKAVMDE